MANVVPESWRNRAFRANEESSSCQSDVEVLPAHDGETINNATRRGTSWGGR